MQKKFFDDIENLRGFACILVLIQHLVWICPYHFLAELLPSWLSIGSGAVHVFFAISGFVVTFSICDRLENLNGNFLDNLKDSMEWLGGFYKRRLFRIFPVVFVVIIACGLHLRLSGDTSSWQSPALRSPFEILFGTFNNSVDTFVFQNGAYFGGLGPFWTLAVESQFYMLWPLALLVCKNNSQRTLLSLVIGVTFTLMITPLINLYLDHQYYWTLNNIAELFLGSFFAFLHKSGFQIRISSTRAKLAVIVSAFSIWFYPSIVGLQKLFYGDIVVTFFSVTILALCAFCEGSFSLLGFKKLFGYLGKRSFSFYAIQLTLANVVIYFTNSVFFEKEKFSESEFYFYQFAIFIILLFVVSELLYRFVEKPCRSLGCNQKTEKK